MPRSDFVRVVSSSEPPSAVSVHGERGEEYCVLTFPKMGAVAYQDGEEKRRWLLQTSHSFEVPVQRHHSTGKLVSVLKSGKGHGLLQWGWKSGLYSGKDQQREVPHDTKFIHTTPDCMHTFVVTASGQAMVLSTKLNVLCHSNQLHGFTPLPVLHSVLLVDDSRHNTFLVANVCRDGDKLGIMCIEFHIPRSGIISANHTAFHLLSPPSSSLDSTVLSFAVDVHKRALSLVWSTGQWEMFALAPGGLTGGFKRKYRKFSRQLSYDVSTGLGCFFSPTSCLVMIGVVNDRPEISIWNPLFGTLLHSSPLLLEEDVPKPCPSLRVYPTRDGSSVAVVLGADVYLGQVPMQDVPVPSLAHALGLMAGAEGETSDTHLATDTTLGKRKRPTLDPSTWGVFKPHTDAQMSTSAAVEQLLQCRRAKEFAKLWKQLKMDPWRLQHEQLCAIARHCVSRDMFTSLRMLFRSGRLTSSSLPGIAQWIIDKKQDSVLECFLRHVADISEQDILLVVSTMLMRVTLPTCKPKQVHFCKYMSEVVYEERSLFHIIAMALSCSFNAARMQELVRELPARLVVRLVLLCDLSLLAYSGRMPVPNAVLASLPTMVATAEWTTLLLDTHAAQMVLSAGCHQSVKELRASVLKMRQDVGQWEEAHGQLFHMLRTARNKQEKRQHKKFDRNMSETKSYCVELL